MALLGRYVSGRSFDGVDMHRSNDSQKERLYKETHVCSTLFKHQALTPAMCE